MANQQGILALQVLGEIMARGSRARAGARARRHPCRGDRHTGFGRGPAARNRCRFGVPRRSRAALRKTTVIFGTVAPLGQRIARKGVRLPAPPDRPAKGPAEELETPSGYTGVIGRVGIQSDEGVDSAMVVQPVIAERMRDVNRRTCGRIARRQK